MSSGTLEWKGRDGVPHGQGGRESDVSLGEGREAGTETRESVIVSLKLVAYYSKGCSDGHLCGSLETGAKRWSSPIKEYTDEGTKKYTEETWDSLFHKRERERWNFREVMSSFALATLVSALSVAPIKEHLYQGI